MNTLDKYKDSVKMIEFEKKKPLPKEAVKDFSEFEDTLKKLKKEEEYSYEDWFYKGLAEQNENNYEEAIKNYNKTIELYPKYSMAYNNRGNAYSDLKQYEKAIKDYNKAIELDPKDAIAYKNRGITYIRIEEYEMAIKDYERALEIKPENLGFLVSICEVRIFLEDYEGSLEDVNRAIDLASEEGDKALCLYLKCIGLKLLDKDTTETEREFDKIVENEFIHTWSFDDIEKWLKKAEISEEKKEFIIEKTELLKKK